MKLMEGGRGGGGGGGMQTSDRGRRIRNSGRRMNVEIVGVGEARGGLDGRVSRSRDGKNRECGGKGR